MASWRYEISLLVLTLEEKFHISEWPSNILYLSFDVNVSSFSLANSPPRDLQITAYK